MKELFDMMEQKSDNLKESEWFTESPDGSVGLDLETVWNKITGKGKNKKNTNHNNLSRPDPDVWHNGLPYDGSKSYKHNKPLYDKQKMEVFVSNKGLHDAHEDFLKDMGRDPRRSEWEKFAAPHLKSKGKARKAIPVVPEQAIERVKPKDLVLVRVKQFKNLVMENKAVALPILIGGGGLLVSKLLPILKKIFGFGKKSSSIFK